MKVRVLSDLHIDIHRDWPTLRPAGEDVTIIAGDICNGRKGITWAREQAEHLKIPVIGVLGNHDYYRENINTLDKELQVEVANGTNFHLLQRSSVEIDGITFLGTTLWTDFNLYSNPGRESELAKQVLSDYRYIKNGRKPIAAEKLIRLHQQQRAWLRDALEKAHAERRKVVVVTHHGPSGKSIARRFVGSTLSAAFVSDLGGWFWSEPWAPRLWIHGHVHDQVDVWEKETRIIANPRGYPNEMKTNGFSWDMTIKI